MSAVLMARGLCKSYRGGDGGTIDVLRGVDLAVAPGETIAIMGASGAGKSTLLHLLGALDMPTAGQVLLEGRSYGGIEPEDLAALRNRRLGFVFQFHHLLRDFTALENVMMPLLIGGVGDRSAHDRAGAVLAEMGLGDRLHHLPGQLSGGEQQRTAVARALVGAPAAVLADEPSGNLDPANAERLHDILAGLRGRFGTALVVATHNRSLAERADRILRLESGVLVAEGLGEEALHA
jgi:lipoprotein-releasing system ATP-binding protein